MAQTDLFTLPHKPWNAGRLVGAKAPLKPKHIWGIRQQLKSTGRIRDLAMFNCALDAKLRGCDLVKLRLGDVVQGGALRPKADVLSPRPRARKGLIAAVRTSVLGMICPRRPTRPDPTKSGGRKTSDMITVEGFATLGEPANLPRGRCPVQFGR